MALRKRDVETSIKAAEAKLAVIVSKSKDQSKLGLRKDPIWRAANAHLKKVKKRLVAIENQAARDAALKERKDSAK